MNDGVLRRLEQVPWRHRSGPYQALDLRFSVRSCDRALGDHLADVLAPFSVASPSGPTTWLSALDRGPGYRRPLVAYLGGRCLVATDDPALVPAYLLWALNAEVVATACGALLVHAAAAERDGAVVVLPGGPGSGKSTLVAGLLRRGYRYVTDELFAVDVASGRIRPYPKALALERGSWPLFPELDPALDGVDQAAAGRAWHVPPARLGAAPMSAGAVPRVVLSPTYQAGATTRVSPLRRSEGLVLLVEHSFNGAGWGQPGLDAAAALLRRCAVVGRLTVGDLEAACDLVDAAVAGTPAAAGAASGDG